MITLDEFFNLLPKDNWILTNFGMIRQVQKHNNYTNCHCPITSVTFKQTGEYFSPDEFRKAAKAIDLLDDLATKIVRASDGMHFYDFSPEVAQVRQRLLEHCGLSTKD